MHCLIASKGLLDYSKNTITHVMPIHSSYYSWDGLHAGLLSKKLYGL